MAHATHRAGASATVVILSTLLVGCVPAGPEPRQDATWSAIAEPATTPATTRASTPEPTPSDDVTAPATSESASPRECPTYDDGYDPTYVAVDSHRYGSVCVGMTLAQANDAVPGDTITGDARCPWVAPVVEADPLAIQAITSPDNPDGPIQFFRLVYMADPVTAPPHEVPATAEGISIGSPAADLAVAYPAAQAVTQEDPSRGPRDQWVIEHAPGYWYVFDIVEDVVAEMTWGVGLDGGIAGELCAL